MANLMKFLSIVEPLGALALIMGFLTRWAASGLAIIMVGAIFIMQFAMHVGFATPVGPGWNFPLVVLAGCIVLMAFGAGRWPVDARSRGDSLRQQSCGQDPGLSSSTHLVIFHKIPAIMP